VYYRGAGSIISALSIYFLRKIQQAAGRFIEQTRLLG